MADSGRVDAPPAMLRIGLARLSRAVREPCRHLLRYLAPAMGLADEVAHVALGIPRVVLVPVEIAGTPRLAAPRTSTIPRDPTREFSR